MATHGKALRTIRSWATFAALLLLPPISAANAGIILPGQEPKPDLVVEIAPLGEFHAPLPESRYVIRRYLDHFHQPEKNSLVVATPKENPAFRSFPVNAIGGERDVEVLRTIPDGTVESEIVFKERTTDIEHRQQAKETGQTRLVWDGMDGAASVAYAGLAGDDFRREQVDSFVVAISTATQPGTIALRIYDASDPTGQIFSTATVAFHKTEIHPAPQLAEPPNEKEHDQRYRLYFEAFVPGPNGGVNFRNVGAVSITIQHSNNEEGKVAIDYLALAAPLNDCPVAWNGTFSVAEFGPAIQWNALPHSELEPHWTGGFGMPLSNGPFSTTPAPISFPPMGAFPPYCPPGGHPPGHFPPGEYCPPGTNPPPSVPEPNTIILVLSAMATTGAYRVIRIVSGLKASREFNPLRLRP